MVSNIIFDRNGYIYDKILLSLCNTSIAYNK